MNRQQCYILQALHKRGIPADLREIFLSRCSATEQDWQELVATGLIEPGKRKEKGRVVLTAEGKRAYRLAKQARNF